MYKTYCLLSFFWICFLFKSHSAILYAENIRTTDSTLLDIRASKEKPFKFYYNDIFGERPVLYEIQKDTLLKLYFDYPILVIVTDSTPTRKTLYSKFHGRFTVNNFLVQPNETILVEKDKENITHFSTKDKVRTNELNFFVAMEKELGLFEGFGADLMPVQSTPIDEITFAREKFESRMRFLSKYQQIYELSPSFISQLQALFLFRKLSSLMSGYYSVYRGTFKKSHELIEQEISTTVKLDEALFYSSEQRSYVQQFLYSWALKRKQPTDAATLISIANETFKGKIREMAMYDSIRAAVVLGQENTNTTLEAYLQYASDSFLKEYVIKSFQPQILAKRLGVNNDILDSELISNKDLEAHTWRELLSTDEHKLIYLDFWASWCAPCRAEMPTSKQLKEEYSTKGIKFVYISIDDNISTWQKAITELGLDSSTHYLMPDGKKSAFADKFKVSSIPRYMLVGRDGTIISDNAPRPTNQHIRSFWDEFLKK
ncbi:TlpA family protein disulfide reductase [Flectobacillus longus]|uniref:TlpA family protein disulfide reductase n=1 Tax=Flectobacillus longus TaxID=2984207 RepID=UPI0024B72E26|nr:TlpA disulfide reductase family protein [Flectobacillus longus]MDI9878638.1 TlpA disulfide reductase family protein [Flectobacillus longus]